MKTKHLALRITLNSVVMINAVYLFLQTITFFRDNLILGISDLSALPAAVGNFVGMYVFMPSMIFGAILYLMALPLQKVQERIESGKELTPEEAEKTRKRILSFSGIILAINLAGFAAGYILLMILSGRLSGLIAPAGLIVLFSNLAGGTVYAAAQTALNNRALTPLRDMLGFHEIGDRKKEKRSTFRQMLLSAQLVLYALFFMQFNIAATVNARTVETDTLRMLVSGEIGESELDETWHALMKERIAYFTDRVGVDTDALPLPWKRSISTDDIQRNVFFLCFFFIFTMALYVQATASQSVRHQLETLKNKVREVLTGGKDLRTRINLLSMDELGEITELINRMLDQFQTVVSRISAAAEETQKGAADINRVLSESEALSKQTGQDVLDLGTKIENQAAESIKLKHILDSFRQGVAGVEQAAETQNRFAAETSSAMEEMASNIQSVESMTSRSGSLTEKLRVQAEDGGKTARESSQAIREIDESASGVLKVIKSLDKIAADINLLAMNAAIEAAHAGDRGLGFAVVADEVRNLASTAGVQTKTIKEILKTMEGRVRQGVEKTGASERALSALIEGIRQAASISSEIAGAMQEQSAGTRSVAQNLGQVLEASIAIRKQTGEQTRETARMADAIATSIENFETLAGDSRTRAEGIRKLESSFTATRTEMNNNLEAVRSLTAEVEGFKI